MESLSRLCCRRIIQSVIEDSKNILMRDRNRGWAEIYEQGRMIASIMEENLPAEILSEMSPLILQESDPLMIALGAILSKSTESIVFGSRYKRWGGPTSAIWPSNFTAVCMQHLQYGLKRLSIDCFVVGDEELAALSQSSAAISLEEITFASRRISEDASHLWLSFPDLVSISLGSPEMASLGQMSVNTISRNPNLEKLEIFVNESEMKNIGQCLSANGFPSLKELHIRARAADASHVYAAIATTAHVQDGLRRLTDINIDIVDRKHTWDESIALGLLAGFIHGAAPNLRRLLAPCRLDLRQDLSLESTKKLEILDANSLALGQEQNIQFLANQFKFLKQFFTTRKIDIDQDWDSFACLTHLGCSTSQTFDRMRKFPPKMTHLAISCFAVPDSDSDSGALDLLGRLNIFNPKMENIAFSTETHHGLTKAHLQFCLVEFDNLEYLCLNNKKPNNLVASTMEELFPVSHPALTSFPDVLIPNLKLVPAWLPNVETLPLQPEYEHIITHVSRHTLPRLYGLLSPNTDWHEDGLPSSLFGLSITKGVGKPLSVLPQFWRLKVLTAGLKSRWSVGVTAAVLRNLPLLSSLICAMSLEKEDTLSILQHSGLSSLTIDAKASKSSSFLLIRLISANLPSLASLEVKCHNFRAISVSMAEFSNLCRLKITGNASERAGDFEILGCPMLSRISIFSFNFQSMKLYGINKSAFLHVKDSGFASNFVVHGDEDRVADLEIEGCAAPSSRVQRLVNTMNGFRTAPNLLEKKNVQVVIAAVVPE